MLDATTLALPPLEDSIAYVRRLGKPTVRDTLRALRASHRVAVQPRCGVGGHDEMLQLLRRLESGAAPEILSLTIDSYTRLLQFDVAFRLLNASPVELNGYPLVSHGWERGRELNEAVRAPLEVRHGSPDARALFATSIAAGITSFEGGGIDYNLPYCKDVPLRHSLEAWRAVDVTCGELARAGLVIDRELFGSLTGVLVPPSISIAIVVLEALCAAGRGVRCVSLAYPQNGELAQDVAALRALRRLASAYLPADLDVFVILHEFMGVFPRDRVRADALIFYGGLTARLGGADKVITKTREEAMGIPTADANVDGMLTTRMAFDRCFDFIDVPDERVEEETYWIEREVHEIVDPIAGASDLDGAILGAFASGRLDVPFSAGADARSAVVPARDASGAVRYLSSGALPLSAATRERNDRRLAASTTDAGVLEKLLADIRYFAP